MPHLKPTPQSRGQGFDAERSLLVLPYRRTTSLYLVAGPDLDVRVDKPAGVEIASFSEGDRASARDGSFTEWEREQVIRRLHLRGESVGRTVLNAVTPDGRPWIKPLEIAVVDNDEARQAQDGGKLTPALREELQKLSFRDALIRVAEDQQNSAIGHSGSGGDGRYDDSGINWCGSFVHWCYATVCDARGVPNPFGGAGRSNNILRSGIKALYAGLRDPARFTVIRYEGPDRYGGLKTTQAFIDISAANPVQRGDICLPRSLSGDTFPHVCMVRDPPDGSGRFTTIDGNQTGAFRPEGASPDCIGANEHETDRKLGDGKTYAFAFVHLKGV